MAQGTFTIAFNSGHSNRGQHPTESLTCSLRTLQLTKRNYRPHNVLTHLQRENFRTVSFSFRGGQRFYSLLPIAQI